MTQLVATSASRSLSVSSRQVAGGSVRPESRVAASGATEDSLLKQFIMALLRSLSTMPV
jgi:hypothetical protein